LSKSPDFGGREPNLSGRVDDFGMVSCCRRASTPLPPEERPRPRDRARVDILDATPAQPRLITLRGALDYTSMSKRTFMSMFGRNLTPIRAGGGKVWFDRHALDRLIDEMAGKPISTETQLTADNREHVPRQMAKRLS
jgi:hypothetical protein